MKVKAVDIARALGISKATVSLALNNRQGVSEQTRAAVLHCREALESGSVPENTIPAEKTSAVGDRSIIKVIVIDNSLSIVTDSALDLWPTARRILQDNMQKDRFRLNVVYTSADPGSLQHIIHECALPSVAGVFLYATEMQPGDYSPFAALKKPLVIFDNDLTQDRTCLVLDNAQGAMRCMDALTEHGCKRITYLAQSIPLYNFEMRRRGFAAGIYAHTLRPADCTVIPVGVTIEDVEQSMLRRLREEPLPDAFLTENYRCTIGLFRAMQQLDIHAPEDVRIIGIDQVTKDYTNGIETTCIEFPHGKRIDSAFQLLIDEIRRSENNLLPYDPVLITSRSTLHAGQTL